MKTNIKPQVPAVFTHEGGPAKRANHEQQLMRSVMSCMLWENEFYESGEEIAKRIASLVPPVSPATVGNMAIYAREKMKLRHVPLLLVREMCKHDTHKPFVAVTLERVIQRADELAEFVAIYWKDGRRPLAAQVKKGLAKAFNKFTAYDLAKYNRDGAVKLRDVLFLCHAKPNSVEQIEVWKQLIDGKLPIPDTWETQLSGGADKQATWLRLIQENKLGALATLRNLRNMQEVGVSDAAIRNALAYMKADRVLPFRFISAAKYGPKFEPELEAKMFECIQKHDKMAGRTILMVDVSGSMNAAVSGKSDITRVDAACGLAMLLREVCEKVEVFTFANNARPVPPRRGFALRDAIMAQFGGGTQLGQSLSDIAHVQRDRIIVITDEQSHDKVPNPIGLGYMVNVASAQNGVGYGPWVHVDGWSEAIVDYIMSVESQCKID